MKCGTARKVYNGLSACPRYTLVRVQAANGVFVLVCVRPHVRTVINCAIFHTIVTQPHLKIESTSGRYFIHVEGSSPQFYRRRLPFPSPDSEKLPCLQEPHHTVEDPSHKILGLGRRPADFN